MESRMFMIFMFVLLSYSVLASDTVEEIRKIHEILKQQQSQILKLQNDNKSLRAENILLRKDVDKLKEIDSRIDHTHFTAEGSADKGILPKRAGNPKQTTNVKDTTLQDISTVPASDLGVVAFSAYMSKNEDNPSSHHTLVFDTAQTNIGNAYNKFTGAFSAPVAGVYVFAWTIYSGDNGKTFFNVLVNNSVYGGTYGETDNVCCDTDSDSGTLVVSLNQGDTVFIRSFRQATTQILSNDSYGSKTTFAGWKLN
ncbi:complement C1q tumor necrosis factor-related protein 1-like [Mytilus trossulus]|uniref:complement C1q tumor necrosis factor-related protein 1-like n=1 Tax=Mytilus trossulus TaxID=6551 RepID=UPI0030043189